MANICEYYPCHDNISGTFSCELCYCPEYYTEKCSGNPKWIYSRTMKIKDCSDCVVNHTKEYVENFNKKGNINNDNKNN